MFHALVCSGYTALTPVCSGPQLVTHSCLAPGSPTLLDLSECIIPIIVYLPCCFVIHLYANMPTKVSRFLVVTRAYVWFNLFQLFSSNLSSGRNQEGWEYIQHYNPFTSHRESTGASTNMSVTPRGVSAVTLPGVTGQPAPRDLSHLGPPPRTSHSGAALRRNCSLRLRS